MGKVLSGVRVIDLAHVKAGPTCAQVLADMGAEVIRVERPGGGIDRFIGPYTPDKQSFYLAYTCRNKKGITLNLQKQKGRELLYKLIEQADIVVEAFGAKGNKRLGVDYNSLKKVKEDIIVVSVSAFGQDGPYAEHTGFDAIAQGISGLMWVTGFPETGKPVRLGVSFIDVATGVFGAFGAVMALYYREKTGKGQSVDMSLLDVAMMFTESIMGEYKVAGKVRPQVGNANVLVAPYDSFQTKDGWVFLGATTTLDDLWRAIGKQELISDPRFQDYSTIANEDNRRFFAKIIGDWTCQRTTEEVVRILNQHEIPCGPINKIPDMMKDPQVLARNMMQELMHPGIGMVPLPGIPIKMSETPGEILSPFPQIGEHNLDVYSKLLGLTSEDIDKLTEEGII